MNFEFLELTELRKLLDTKQVSSLELTKYFLERIKKHADLNAFITVCEESALRQAQDADEFISSAGENPFLCGIPYAAKDLFCTKGIRTTAASKILDNYIPPYDSTVIEKLKEQKAVLLGKTNLDQFAHGSSGETSGYGPTKNPWDKTRMPGGSSSGSAAAVIAGLAPFALGTETGGSIRIPGTFCNLTGWKPTYGRVSRYGVVAMASSLDSIGALGYSVKDLAHLAEIMSGFDSKDSTTTDVPVLEYVKNLNADLSGVKIGIPKEYFYEGVTLEGSPLKDIEQRIEAKVKDAIKILESRGATLVDLEMPFTKYGSMVYAVVCPSEVSSNLARYDGIRYGHVTKEAKNLLDVYEKTRSEGFGDEAKRRVLTGTYVLSAGFYEAYYKKAQKVRGLIIKEFNEVFKKVDVIVGLSSPNVASKLGKAADDPLFGYIADQLHIPSSLAGMPAVALPCGFTLPADGETPSMDGLPTGFQIIGPQWGEQKVFNVGYAYQQATDWHKKHPTLA